MGKVGTIPETGVCAYCRQVKDVSKLRPIGNGEYECVNAKGKAYHTLPFKQKIWESYEEKKSFSKTYRMTIEATITLEEI